MSQNISDRIKELRTKKNLTQSQLAERVGITYVQIGRYETRKSTPSSEILQKLAAALDTTSDYLVNGSSSDIVSEQLLDKELLSQFKKVEELPVEKKNLVKEFLDAFLFKDSIKQQLSH